MVRLPAWVHQSAQNHVRSGGHHAHFEVDARSLLGGRSLFFPPRKNFEVVAAWSFSPGKHFEVVAGLTQPFCGHCARSGVCAGLFNDGVVNNGSIVLVSSRNLVRVRNRLVLVFLPRGNSRCA